MDGIYNLQLSVNIVAKFQRQCSYKMVSRNDWMLKWWAGTIGCWKRLRLVYLNRYFIPAQWGCVFCDTCKCVPRRSPHINACSRQSHQQSLAKRLGNRSTTWYLSYHRWLFRCGHCDWYCNTVHCSKAIWRVEWEGLGNDLLFPISATSAGY